MQQNSVKSILINILFIILLNKIFVKVFIKKMRICSVICEYNPFHNGHLYQLEKIKNELKPDFVIGILSGNFVQRGEFACLDKYTRAILACKMGMDMVIELPTLYALSPAEIFSKGGISIIKSIPFMTNISFGVEDDNLDTFYSVLDIDENDEEYKLALKKRLDLGERYPKAVALAKNERFKIDLDFLSKPNNILALEYLKELKGSEIKPFLVKRVGDSLLDDKVNSAYPSATAIRALLKENNLEEVKKYLPKEVFDEIEKRSHYSNKSNLAVCLSLIRGSAYLKDICDVTEGLENRIFEMAKKSKTDDELLENLKTKRYTDAKLRRILSYIILDVKKELMEVAKTETPYIKILAVKKSSLELLSVITKQDKCKIITEFKDTALLNENQKKIFEKDMIAENIFKVFCYDYPYKNMQLV